MLKDLDTQPIIALCTPRGSGALALIRLTGDGAITCADQSAQLSSKKKLADLPGNTIHYGTIIDSQNVVIDTVMFLLMRAPKTFTGQDTVEITCHNNNFIIDAIIECVIKHGARLAQNGEFSKRAYLNNKIDLIQAEAINELIHASHQRSLQQSLAQLRGTFSSWIATIEKELVKNLALSEASFEFLDEEHMEFNGHIKESVQQLLSKITEAKKTFNQQQQVREGIKIALIGSVNAGKSSLFNALINKERAIVTDIAGTTRDSIEAGIYLNNTYRTFIDTAGLRQTNDIVEKKGIERSFEEAHKADIILLIIDQARLMTPEERSIYQTLLDRYQEKIIVVYNKSDLLAIEGTHFGHTPCLRVSTRDKQSIVLLEKEIEHRLEAVLGEISSPFLLNNRHFNLIIALEADLTTILGMLDNPEYELISYHLKHTIMLLAELTGKTVSENGMNALFKEFCVGK